MNLSMTKKSIFVLTSALFATVAFAGEPGKNTNGSTITTVSANVDNVAECLISANASSINSDTGLFANAIANTIYNININYTGDVKLDLTRHGQNGAVHQIELTASMDNGTLFAQSAKSSTYAVTNATAASSSEVEAVANMIGKAVATLFQGIDFNVDLLVTDITVKAGSEAKTEVNMEAGAYAKNNASADSSASAASESYAIASVTNSDNSTAGSSFYVQGANIEEFGTQLSLASGALVNVNTESFARAYANAIAASIVHALAEASVQAEAESKLSFVYDLPIIGSGELPIVTDYDSATNTAQQIADAEEAISALAKAMAMSSARTIGSSSIGMNLSVQYKNLPGTEDMLAATATGNFELDCSHSNTSASADTYPNAD